MSTIPANPPVVLRAGTGPAVDFGGLGARFLVDAAHSGGGFSLVEHPLAARTLGSPMHLHRHEDEWSYVLEGEVGVQVGDDVLRALPGDLVHKPRGIPHAFWNATEAPARLLEIISPGGFEAYFADIAPLLPPARAEPDLAGLAAVMARYGLEPDFDSIAAISRREGLPLPPA